MEVLAALITGFFGLFTVWYSHHLNKSRNLNQHSHQSFETTSAPNKPISRNANRKPKKLSSQLIFSVLTLGLSMFTAWLIGSALDFRETEHGILFTLVWTIILISLTISSYKQRYFLQMLILILGAFFWGVLLLELLGDL